jgi:hypothetical protein
MATYTVPTTRTSGDLITASIWNTDLVENIKYFKDSPSITALTTSGAATIGGTLTAAAATFTGDVSLAATKKLYLDGGSNTYLYESVADTISFVVSGTERLKLGPTGVLTLGNYLVMRAGDQLFLDGGSDTYIYESAANRIRFTTGGVDQVLIGGNALECLGSTSIIIPATQRIYLDGGGDTYMRESAANQLDVIAGGSGGVRLSSGATSWSAISDERLKTTLTPFDRAAEKVAALRPGTGRYLTDDASVSRSFLLAQDVQSVLPEAVSADEAGILSLRYADLIPLLVAAIQHQQERINALEARLN